MPTLYEVGPLAGQHLTLFRLTGSQWLSAQHLLNASQQSEKLNWTPSFTHRAKPSLLIFTVSERNKAASPYGKSVPSGAKSEWDCHTTWHRGSFPYSIWCRGTPPNNMQDSDPVRGWTQIPIHHPLRCFIELCDESSCVDMIKTLETPESLSCWFLCVPGWPKYSIVSGGCV